MADDVPLQVWLDPGLATRIGTQAERYGWTRKEFFRRILLDALPRLEAAEPALLPEAERAAE